ncbi:MAG TPA: hypothetical protein VJZ27_13890, partial [Aggregatilineales bacterium]|nr:hypothetical protein [Aggregatilineales bacterium]
MPTIQAYQYNVDFDRYNWQLFDRMNTKTVNPIFEYTRGDNVIYYDADYGANIGLPGNRMSIEY